MQFNLTATSQGIVQDIDFLVDTSSTTYPLAQKVRNANRWLDRAVSIILTADGRWQWDDTNATTQMSATTDMVDGQQDYTLDTTYIKLHRVEVKDSAGNWIKLKPLDIADLYDTSVTDFLKTDGVPQYYDVIGRSLMLYPAAAAASVTTAAGLKVWAQRTPSYFSDTDTTMSPGINPLFHRYVSYGAAFDYAIKKQLPQKEDLKREILEMEEQIKGLYAMQNKDDKVRLGSKYSRNGIFQ